MTFIEYFEFEWFYNFFFREAIDVQYILTRDEDRLLDAIELIKPASNDDYIGKIRKRLQEDESARAEREKRRRKVLVDQMKAHEAQEVWYNPKSHLEHSTPFSAFPSDYQIYSLSFAKPCDFSSKRPFWQTKSVVIVLLHSSFEF